MLDAIIAGAGPAGTITALLLARTGARVLLIDRATFPRAKLCGDTLNPGAVRFLASIGLTGGPLTHALPLAGMRVSSPRAEVSARYDGGQVGLSLTRRDLDTWLVDEAMRSGVRFESPLRIVGPLVEESAGEMIVRGLQVVSPTGVTTRLPARMTIAADGRRSVVARAVGLHAASRAPRRWAFGTYATDVPGMTDLGEMHLRAGWYLGLAPLAGGLTNVCLVTGPRPGGRTPIEILHRTIEADPALAARVRAARLTGDFQVLGPLATDVTAAGLPGLLLAGDASGFVDPMTGDGLHLAMQSARLAAEEALRALDTDDIWQAPARLQRRRRALLGTKLQFNRMLRRLAGSPRAIDVAGSIGRVAPSAVRMAICYAGDVP
jgi:flavin-dependent dehydrogenase